MADVVHAIRRVTDIMGEISAASSEQSQGVAQVNTSGHANGQQHAAKRRLGGRNVCRRRQPGTCRRKS